MDWLALMCCAHDNTHTHTQYVPRSWAHKIQYEIFTLSARALMRLCFFWRECDVTQRTTLLCNAKRSQQNTEHSRPHEKHRQFENSNEKNHKNKSFLPKPLIWLKLWALTGIKELQAQLWWAWLLNNMVINTTINQSPWQDLQFRRDQPK